MALNIEIYPKEKEGNKSNYSFLNSNLIDLQVSEYYPGKEGITLKNGSFVTFVPNEMKRVVLTYDFIATDELDKIIIDVNSIWTIINDESTLPDTLQNTKQYVIEGTDIDYTYSDRFLQAGFTGSLTFIETVQ